jgi:outer membrane protein OmpA-like peptidoglycan-associated protein
MSDSSEEGCGCVVVALLMWGAVHETHTWIINAEAATKRFTYKEMVVSDTRDWIKDSGSFITEFGLTQQTLDQKIESVATKYAPILNDLDSKLEYQELELKSKIKSLEKILTHFKRDAVTDKELNKWKKLLELVSSDKIEVEDLKKTLYFSEQKSVLNPNTKQARDELDNMVKYISLSAQKTEMELNKALNQ